MAEQNTGQAELLDALRANTEAQQRVADAAPPKKVHYSRYKTRSPFNPKGVSRSAPERKLTRKVYQNGNRLNERNMFAEEIRLLNELEPGKYIGGLVTVEIVKSTSADPDELRIHYSNATMEQRLNIAQQWGSLVSLLRKCTTEYTDRMARQRK